jgi:hypothetical protein
VKFPSLLKAFPAASALLTFRANDAPVALPAFTETGFAVAVQCWSFKEFTLSTPQIPMKPPVTVILASILVLLPGMISAYQAPGLVRPVESTPTRLEELDFSVVTQDEWRAFRYWGSKFNPAPDGQDEIPLQLRIVNRGSKSIVVPTFDSFTPMLKGPDGQETPLGKSRDYTVPTAPILLKPGQGYSYAMIARLVEPHDGDGIELIFRDRTGGGSVVV